MSVRACVRALAGGSGGACESAQHREVCVRVCTDMTETGKGLPAGPAVVIWVVLGTLTTAAVMHCDAVPC